MLKIFKSFCLLLLVCTGMQAQNLRSNGITLSGTVKVKKDSTLLPGAAVYIPDLKLGVLTDVNGAFAFKQLPKGNFLVVVSFVGYKSISRLVNLTNNDIEHFYMEESSREVEQITVTGTSKATEIKRNPVPIATINTDYIVTNTSTNIIDAISTIPGVSAVTTGPNISKPFIRGLGYNRILTLYDGIRQEGQQWGDEHGIEIDQYGINNIEVIKGPASLSYGSDALAGVVNLVPTQPAPEGKMLADLILEHQTNNKYLGGSFLLSGTKHGIEWDARFSQRLATNYQNNIDGRVYGTAFNETDAHASVGIHRSWGFSHLTFVLYNDLQEIPDGSRDSLTRKFTQQISEADTFRPIVSNSALNSYKIAVLHQLVQHYRLFSNNSFIIGEGRLNVNVGYQYSARREYSHPAYPSIPGLYLQLQVLTYDINYNYPEIRHWLISTGINGMYQNNVTTNGTEFIIPDYTQFDIGGFAIAKKTFGRLDISGGIRYDIRQFNNQALYTATNPATGFDMPTSDSGNQVFTNYHHNYTGISGSIGSTYNFNEHISLKANAARGYRAPNIAEISANGVHPGTNVYQIGNGDFKPEFSLQEDLGLIYAAKSFELTIGVFDNYINNYIYNQKLNAVNGSDSVIVKGNQTFKFVQSRANLYGGEISLDIHPIKNVHFENTLSIVNGQNRGMKNGPPVTDSTKYLPFIPPLHGTSEVRLGFGLKALHVTHGYIKVQWEYYAQQNKFFSAYGTETATPGYNLFNIGLGGSILNKHKKILCNVYAGCNNLFDIAYQDHLSRLKYFEPYRFSPTGHYGIYNMGRNFSVKLNIPFSFDI